MPTTAIANRRLLASYNADFNRQENQIRGRRAKQRGSPYFGSENSDEANNR